MNASDFVRTHFWKMLVFILAISVLAWISWDHLSRDSLMSYAESLPKAWLAMSFFLLPMVGFPISVLLVILGIRFGFAQGMLITAAGMAFHHMVGYLSVHGMLRHWLKGKIRQWGHKVPKLGDANSIWFTFLFAAFHGPPYTLKIYLLALTEVPFRVYFLVGFPVYLSFAAIPVAAGGAITSVDPTWIYIAIAFITIVSITVNLVSKKRKNQSWNDSTE